MDLESLVLSGVSQTRGTAVSWNLEKRDRPTNSRTALEGTESVLMAVGSAAAGVGEGGGS